MAVAPWPGWPSCPCGCGEQGLKLQIRHDRHLVGCRCRPCLGRRSQRKGKANQARTHRRLGGEGFTPSNEESARPYEVTVSVMPEHKGGEQVPKTFDRFLETKWFRRALSQAARAVPAGSGALPAVTIRSQWCIVDIRRRKR